MKQTENQLGLFAPVPAPDPRDNDNLTSHIPTVACGLRGCFVCTSRWIGAKQFEFESTGALNGRESSRFFRVATDAGFTYNGYTFLEDGCPLYAWSDPRTGHCHAIRADGWNGTEQGLRDKAAADDSEYRRIMGGLI